MTLLKAVAVSLSLIPLMGCITTRFNIAADVRCRNSQGDSLCPKLSHLQTGVTLSPGDDWDAKLSYDFAQSRKASWYDSLDTHHLDLPPQKSWLADYGLRKQIDSRWSLAIEDSSGTTLIPDASYLAFSKNLQDIGWKQTAVRLGFDHKEVFEADVILGLGEGERLSSDDEEPYFGARARWYLMRAIGLQLAFSEDKNSLNKDALWWLTNTSELRRGFQTQRFAASLILNGKLSIARGLEASLGWQSNHIHGQRPDIFTAAPSDLAFDPTESLAQALGGSGGTRRQTLYYSASYRILAEYIVAFHASEYQSQFNETLLTSCDEMDNRGGCVGSTDKKRSFRLRETSYGIGKIDDDGWAALLEAHEERYDRLYQNFHFRNGRHPRQKSTHLLQARIAWNW